MGAFITESPDGVLLKCRVIPSSSRNGIAEIGEEFIRIKVTAPPVEGRANSRLVNFLSKYFRVSRGRVKIRKGETGRQKEIFIAGLRMEEVLTRLKEAK